MKTDEIDRSTDADIESLLAQVFVGYLRSRPNLNQRLYIVAGTLRGIMKDDAAPLLDATSEARVAVMCMCTDYLILGKYSVESKNMLENVSAPLQPVITLFVAKLTGQLDSGRMNDTLYRLKLMYLRIVSLSPIALNAGAFASLARSICIKGSDIVDDLVKRML